VQILRIQSRQIVAKKKPMKNSKMGRQPIKLNLQRWMPMPQITKMNKKETLATSQIINPKIHQE